MNKLKMTEVLEEVHAERLRQNEKWGGAEHDDKHNFDDWVEFISNHNIEADIFFTEADISKARKELIEVAALAVAAIESLDRKVKAHEINT